MKTENQQYILDTAADFITECGNAPEVTEYIPPDFVEYVRPQLIAHTYDLLIQRVDTGIIASNEANANERLDFALSELLAQMYKPVIERIQRSYRNHLKNNMN
jgi:hypothetical protein